MELRFKTENWAYYAHLMNSAIIQGDVAYIIIGLSIEAQTTKQKDILITILPRIKENTYKNLLEPSPHVLQVKVPMFNEITWEDLFKHAEPERIEVRNVVDVIQKELPRPIPSGKNTPTRDEE
jgi:hypothetical protein